MRVKSILLLTAIVLAGCGTNRPDREAGGAATGAGTGAVIGLLGGPVGVVAGALIGAGVGAGTGAAVSPDHVNLGPPVWSDRQDHPQR
jgi:phage tail tape-measure protein